MLFSPEGRKEVEVEHKFRCGCRVVIMLKTAVDNKDVKQEYTSATSAAELE